MKVKALHSFMLGPDYPAMQYLIPEEQNILTILLWKAKIIAKFSFLYNMSLMIAALLVY